MTIEICYAEDSKLKRRENGRKAGNRATIHNNRTMSNVMRSARSCLNNDLFTYTLLNDDSVVNFAQAQQLCTEENGNLARISNREEYELVKNFRNSSINTWVGIDAINSIDGGQADPKNFVFTDGVTEKLDFIQNLNNGEFPWSGNEPNAFENNTENCVELFIETDLFDDSPCSKLNSAFACRIVDSSECTESSEGSSLLLGGVVGGLCVVGVIFLIFFLIRPKNKDFKLEEYPNGVNPRRGVGPPQTPLHPYLKPDKISVARGNAFSDFSNAESSIISEVYSADSTGLNFRNPDH